MMVTTRSSYTLQAATMHLQNTCLRLVRLAPRGAQSSACSSPLRRLSTAAAAAAAPCKTAPKPSSKTHFHTLTSPLRTPSKASASSNSLSSSSSKLIFAAGRPRFSSTATDASAAAAAPSASTQRSSLTWNEYLALRTKRRRIGLLFSVLCAGATTSVGAAVLGSQDTDKLGAYSFGMDPVVVLGMATAACGALGWLVGPFLGSGVFSVMYRRVGGAMREKETEFYKRIRRNRSDPIGQSVNNPVPDYYGEKITSVKDYRRWLKDQRAFRRKREVNVL